MALNIKTGPSAAQGTSLTYVTIGAMLAIWSAVWYFGWNLRNPWATICVGLFLTGLTFLAIGFGIGHLGREARKADLPPEDAVRDLARAEARGSAEPPAAAPLPPTNVYNT